MTKPNRTKATPGTNFWGRAASFRNLLAACFALSLVSAASAEQLPVSPMAEAEVWAGGMISDGPIDCAASRSWVIFLPNGSLLAIEGPKIYFGSWSANETGRTIHSTGSGLRQDDASSLWSMDREQTEARTIRLRDIGSGRMAATVHSADDGVLVRCDNPPDFKQP